MTDDQDIPIGRWIDRYVAERAKVSAKDSVIRGILDRQCYLEDKCNRMRDCMASLLYLVEQTFPYTKAQLVEEGWAILEED